MRIKLVITALSLFVIGSAGCLTLNWLPSSETWSISIPDIHETAYLSEPPDVYFKGSDGSEWKTKEWKKLDCSN